MLYHPNGYTYEIIKRHSTRCGAREEIFASKGKHWSSLISREESFKQEELSDCHNYFADLFSQIEENREPE